MERRNSDNDLASSTTAASPTATAVFEASSTATNDMGRAYRTPSPAPEAYISDSIVNTPTVGPAPAPSFSNEYDVYQQLQAIPALDIAAAESGNPESANTSYLGAFFGQPHSCETSAATPVLTTEEPRTPTKKRIPNHLHGLPSPQTPTYSDSTFKAPSAGSSHSHGEDVTVTTPHTPQEITDRDALLAHELEVELGATTTRRSTRLRKAPETYAPQVPEVAPRALCTKPAPSRAKETPEQPEFSVVPFKADLLPFEGLPTVHSLSWQLQYPPGGSTHPSYPYPLMDPRLIFHQPFVPLVDGLPDFTRVPKLVLPMGWRHVAWAGLLPIAFDPYRQAFKLTPVGPMPLTCEELRQGGLHKYVPGGELHPELGLLPDMLKLSDGSDAEVFDFENVDWTLPWEGRLDLHAPANSTTDIANSYPTPTPDTTASTAMIFYPWREQRDCPDKIIDLSDAWRWLAGKEVNPTADYVPTPEKSWWGTGAYRSQRKLKSPIPELMMLAQIQDADDPDNTPNTNPLLQKQDTFTSNRKNLFCPYKSVATPMNVDITLLDDTELTIMELLSYFPQHYYWGHAADRLAKAGVTYANIRDIINMSRALQGEAALLNSSVGSAAQAAKRRDLIQPEEVDIDEVGKETPVPNKPDIVDMSATCTAEGWVYAWDKIDYPLLALAHGLQVLPSGPDAGPLSELILWCRKEGKYQVLLSQVPALLKEATIEPLIEPGESGCPDKEVIARHAAAMKKDRLRVLRSAGEKKRAHGDKEESKSKKQKVSE